MAGTKGITAPKLISTAFKLQELRRIGTKMKLDIGCGANKVGSDFIGLDVSKTPCVDVVASADALPFKSDSFTEIFTKRCVQHVKDDKRALSEIHRVLQKNGEFKLVVASWRGWLFYQCRWLLQKKPYAFFHLYTSGKLKQMLREAGFSNINVSRIPSARRFGYDIVVETKKD